MARSGRFLTQVPLWTACTDGDNAFVHIVAHLLLFALQGRIRFSLRERDGDGCSTLLVHRHAWMSETQPDAKRSRSSDEKGTICVSGAEGEDVRWPLWAARHAGTLKNWIEDSDGEGSFPAPNISADTLRSLLALLTARLAIAGVPVIDSALASLSPDKLTAVARAANFLAVSDVLVAAARELCRRFLTGKSVDDLRVALGVGLDESLNEAEQAAALSELAFTPDDAPSRLLAVEPRCAPFAAALEAGRLMPVDVTIDDDTLELMLHEADTMTLCLLKGVSVAWLARARRALCARFCCQEGHPVPTNIAGIESLNVEHLSAAGRLFDVVVAGSQLPNLTRLSGYGFQVSLSAVREAKLHRYYKTSITQDELDDLIEQDLEQEETDFERKELLHAMEDFSLRSCAALLKCASREATRDGESSHETKPPPRELLLVAIACVCSGAVFGIPIQRLRDGGRKKLDLSGIGPDAAHLLALLLPGTKTRSLLYAPPPHNVCLGGRITRLPSVGRVGFQPLPIMKLRGTKPAESINLSGRGLSSACIIIIASCIKGNAVLKKLE